MAFACGRRISFHHFCLLCCVIVCFIIGLPMWLVGCNPNIENGCLTRDLDWGNVTGIAVQSGVCCSSCKCGKSTCCCGGYNCYTTSIGINTANGHCDSSVDGTFYSESDAYSAGAAVGNVTRVEIDPRTKLCTINLLSELAVWYSGVIFLCFCAFCCVICCGIIIVTSKPASAGFDDTNNSNDINLQTITSTTTVQTEGLPSSQTDITVTTSPYASPYSPTQPVQVDISFNPNPQNVPDNTNTNTTYQPSSSNFGFQPQHTRNESESLPRRPSGDDKPPNYDDGPPAYDDAPPSYD